MRSDARKRALTTPAADDGAVRLSEERLRPEHLGVLCQNERPRCPGCGHSCCPYPRLECGGESDVVTAAACDACGDDPEAEGIERVLADHGAEFSDGLEYIHCDCGWTIDAYIGAEEGLAAREGEIPALTRHRAHVAGILAVRRRADEDGLRAAIETLAGQLCTCSPGTRHWAACATPRLRAVLARHPADQTGAADA